METQPIIQKIKKELSELDMLLDGMAHYPSVPVPLIDLTETKLNEIILQLQALKEPLAAPTEQVKITPDIPEVITEVKITMPEEPIEVTKDETPSTQEHTIIIEALTASDTFKEMAEPIAAIADEPIQVQGTTNQEESEATTDELEKAAKLEEPTASDAETIPEQTEIEEEVLIATTIVETEEIPLENIIDETSTTPLKTARTLSETHQGTLSRNDTLAGKAFSSIGARIEQSPITDIKKAINLNDRFRFQRELFNGDNLLFDETLKTLNELNSIEEAQELIASTFNWNYEDSITQEFILIVQRRFI